MARYIVDLNEEFGMTVMMIEHDMGRRDGHFPSRHGAGFRPQDRRRRSGFGSGRPSCEAGLSRRGRDEVLVDPDDKPRRSGVRGMMDYGPARIARARYLSETVAASTLTNMAARSRLREKGLRTLAHLHLERLSDPRCVNSRSGLIELGLGPRRCHRHHRRQPAGLGVGGNRNPCRRAR